MSVWVCGAGGGGGEDQVGALTHTFLCNRDPKYLPGDASVHNNSPSFHSPNQPYYTR